MADIKELSQKRKDLLAAECNLLVLGGPGSGKTTIALLKAAAETAPGKLQRGQKILFLSFARATIARVAQHAVRLVGRDAKDLLEINTYHGFIWKLLRSHGYLICSRGVIELLPPPQAAAHLADIPDKTAREVEKRRLFDEDGILHFDLFAETAASLLTRSQALRRIISDAYPLIILDEFQDTNPAEWEFIKTLGSASRLIALADAEQRIYEFRGADPKRIGEFVEAFGPDIFDFANENHRSDGKDIVTFGNDLIRGANKGKVYTDVSVARYGYYQGLNALYPLKTSVLARLKVAIKADPQGWSLAVLVPTRKLMIQASEYLSANTDRLPALGHDVAMDTEAPALAAGFIAMLMEGGAVADLSPRLISDLCQHIRGRRGNDPTPQTDLTLVGALGTFLQSGNVRGAKRQRIVSGATNIATARLALVLTGDPEADWLTVRRLLSDSNVQEYQQIAEDARYLRLLHKGATLRSRLSEIWRQHGGYKGASAAVRDALLQEHFSASVKDWRGIHVMTIHKSKGKEFSEVVVFEGVYAHRIVRASATDGEIAQSSLALRVAVTRAMNHATIVTPASDPCPLL